MKNVGLYTGLLNGIDKYNKLNLIHQMAENIEKIAANKSNTEFLEGITFLYIGPFVFELNGENVETIMIHEAESK